MPDVNLRPDIPDAGRPAPPRLVWAALEYVRTAEWIFAKTMADNPHWYCVRARAQAAGMRDGHEALYRLCRDYSYSEWWGYRTWRAVDFDGFHIWIVDNGDVINRKPIVPALFDEPYRRVVTAPEKRPVQEQQRLFDV